MTNSRRFIDAYNTVDKMIRSLYGFKPSLTYTDVVRKAASFNSLVRKYEDDLLDYGRLRNAIVHKSDSEMAIAEPHTRVVEHIEHIAELLKTPPLAVGTVARPASTLPADATVEAAIKLMAGHNYSNVPVMEGRVIVGVLTNKLIVEALAKNLEYDLDDFIETQTVGSILTENRENYAIMKATATIEEVLQAFGQSRKLQIVILTSSGRADGEIKGVVTTGNIIDINKIMDNY